MYKNFDRVTALVLLTTVVLLVWQIAAIMDDRYFAAFGHVAVVFWVMEAVWIAYVGFALRQRRQWWLLITAPVVLLPVYHYVSLIISCMRGSCL